MITVYIILLKSLFLLREIDWRLIRDKMEDVKVEYRGYNLAEEDYVIVDGNVKLTSKGLQRVKSINKKFKYDASKSEPSDILVQEKV